ncbi:MAG: tetratricopeptide repeat protein, partial [Anaerolineales bacterium]
EADNRYAAAHIGLGAAGLQLGRLEEALSACNWAVELEPENRRAHTGLGEVFLARRQYAEAERAFQRAIELDPGAAAAFGGLGAAHLANGQLPAAMAAYDRAAELEPDHPKHWSGRAHVLAAQGKFEDAHAAYRHAIGLGGLVGSDLAVAYNGFGAVCRVLGRPDEAVEAYQQAIVLDPSYAVPHSGLGVVFMEQGRYEEAQSALQRALKLGELEPEDAARVHFNLGKVLTLMDHTREARAEYERAVEQSPAFAAAHIALAGGYRRQGKNGPFTKAIDHARSVTDDGNEYDRAVLEALCDQIDEALDLLDAALQHKQTTVAWARRDPDLSFVRDNPRFEAIVQEYVL